MQLYIIVFPSYVLVSVNNFFLNFHTLKKKQKLKWSDGSCTILVQCYGINTSPNPIDSISISLKGKLNSFLNSEITVNGGLGL